MRTLFFMLAAMPFMATNASAAEAEPVDTMRAYFIDGQMVKNFTGKELIGRTIKDYHIYYSKMDKPEEMVVLLHEIKTDKAPIKADSDKPLVFVNGKYEAKGIDEVKPSDIKSMTMVKDLKMLAAYEKQGYSKESLKNGVILIVTKDQSSEPIVYLVNGVETRYTDVAKIPSDKIKSMDIIKGGTNDSYVKQYGKGVDVVEISTK